MAIGDPNQAPTGAPDVPMAPLAQPNAAGQPDFFSVGMRQVQPQQMDFGSLLGQLGSMPGLNRMLQQLGVGGQQQPQQQWRSPFIGWTPRRSGFGSPWWPISTNANYPGTQVSPMLPSPLESLGLITQIGQQLQQFGAPSVAGPAGQASIIGSRLAMFLDLASKGQFSKQYLAARLGNMKLMEDQMILHNEQVLENHRNLLEQYDKVLDTAKYGGYSKDKAQNLEIAKQKIADIARINQDHSVEGVLANKDLPGVESYLAAEDLRFRTLHAANEATKKSRADGGKDPWAPDEDSGDRVKPESLAPPTQTPTVSGRPATQTAQGPQTPAVSGGGQENIDEQLKSDNQTGNAGLQTARNIAFNGAKPLSTKDDPSHTVANTVANLQKRARDIMDGPGDNAAKVAQLNQLSPELGNQVKDIGQYRTPLQRISESKLNTLLPMAERLYGYDQNRANAVKRLWDSQSRANSVMLRANDVPQAAANILDALKDIPEDSVPDANVIRQWEAGHFTGDPKWAKLYQAITEGIQSINVVQTATGGTRVTWMREILRHLSPTSSPRTIREQLMTDVSDIWSNISNYQHQWEHASGRHTLNPALQPGTMMDFSALLRMDRGTGQMPSDASPHLLSVSKDPSQRDPSVTPRTPFTAADYKHALDYINANRNSTDRRVIEQVNKAIQMIGAQRNMPVDEPPED